MGGGPPYRIPCLPLGSLEHPLPCAVVPVQDLRLEWQSREKGCADRLLWQPGGWSSTVVVADGKRCDLKTAREVWKTLMISGPSCGPALFYDVCFLKSLTGRFRVPEEPDPFFYDYATVQTVGMVLATVMFLLGVIIIVSKKVKCRKADSRSESPTCKSCKSELPSSAPGGGGV
uniref:FXYD domain-containing ion transport regulator n=1 Tax=Castor canadensis TaxID=51338 RepID=A0A8B7VUU4_CASCN|nr:FXYD domain-containing ion transport regulator 7 [Castor canadensis]